MGTVFIKDARAEFRSRYAINAILAFTGSTLLLLFFSLDITQLEIGPQSGILWIIILFAALLSLSRSFVSETEQHTFALLKLHASAAAIYGGKLIYNYIFILAVNVAVFVLYILALGVSPDATWQLVLILLFGSAGLAGISTMLAAIVSQADRKGAVFSVLSVPLLFPLILVLVDATTNAFVKGTAHPFLSNILAVIGFAGTTIVAGFLLFDFIWND